MIRRFARDAAGARASAPVAVLLAAVGATMPAAGATCAVDHRVAPTGCDRGPGMQSQPFATLHRARDAVRADWRRQRCEIAVNIAGTHRLAPTLTLDARDSGACDADVVDGS